MRFSEICILKIILKRHHIYIVNKLKIIFFHIKKQHIASKKLRNKIILETSYQLIRKQQIIFKWFLIFNNLIRFMQQEPKNSHSKYTVAVRIRPTLQNNAHSVFSVASGKYVKQVRPKSIVTYSFDQAFQPQHDNAYIYENSVKQKIDFFLHKKINTTILAYGQTGSGKTHTLFGHAQKSTDTQKRQKGLTQMILSSIIAECLGKVEILCSFMQIYKQKVTDLLSGAKINLRDDQKGQLNLGERTVVKVQSLQQILKTLSQANSNKIFGNSYVHSQSSRSHVMFTLLIGKTYLNIVDLCGSEVLTFKFDEKQREETNSINLSLFTLNAVINDLCDQERGKFLPFRNSVLTRLLKPSLINIKKTQIYLFCNIAPQQSHRNFSVNTLKFGQTAISIDQQQTPTHQIINLSQQKRDNKKVSNIIDLNVKQKKTQLQLYKWNTYKQKIQGQKVILYEKKGSQNAKTNILFLHAYGYGCCGEDWDYFIPYIIKNIDANIYSVDFPGFGNSAGKKFTSRAEKFGDKGQPIDFMADLFKIFKFSKSNQVFLIGYDLGGAIALSCAMHSKLKNSIKGVSCFHPTWTDKIQTLAMITIPVQLIWVPVQTFHLVSAGQKMSKVIKNCNLYKLNMGPYTGEKAGGYYDLYSDTIGQLMNEFIINIQPPVAEKPKRRGKIEEQIIQIDIDKQQQELLKSQNAVKEFYNFIKSDKYKQVFDALIKGGENKPKYVRLASEMPVINCETKIEQMIKFGLFQQGVKNKLSDKLPLLPAGRQIHVKTKIQLSALAGKNKYLAYDPKGEKGITHRCKISPQQKEEQIIDNGKIKVKIETVFDKQQQIQVDLGSVVQLNSETLFRSVNGSLVFEDQVTCKYESLITKLMLARCCYAIKDLVCQLDLTKNTIQTLKIQQKCAKKIFQTMDLRHLVHEGIDNTRFTGIDVGKLAYYGQGNCHHLASVLAALLLPFSKILGWDVIFRAGSYIMTGRDINQDGEPLPNWNGKPNVNVEDHTWLEIVYKPSFKPFVMDPSFGICSTPFDQIYTFKGKMHISGKRQCQSKNPSLPETIFEGHTALQ